MAFGRIRRRREKKRDKRDLRSQEQEDIKREAAASQEPAKIIDELKDVEEGVSAADEADRERLESVREKAKEESYEDVTTDVPGMSEEQKRAMRESANAQIDSQVQNYQRTIASQTGRSGIRGGAAAAPQISLAKQGLAAQNQFQRDLVEKDSDIAMQKLASYMASLEGKTAEDILRRQQYFDYISGQKDKKKEDFYRQYYGNKFDKV